MYKIKMRIKPTYIRQKGRKDWSKRIWKSLLETVAIVEKIVKTEKWNIWNRKSMEQRNMWNRRMGEERR